MTAFPVVPVQAVSGGVHDSTQESASAPLLVHGAPIADPGEALRNPYAAELNRLHTFLVTSFPREVGRTNVQKPESTVDIAMRLLRGLSTTGPYVRCSAEYCNLPVDHDGEHGFVHFSAHSG